MYLICCCFVCVRVALLSVSFRLMFTRRRRAELRPSLIDVDNTYIIDGEGQPAILALDSQVRACFIFFVPV